jgi:hypothetical protein
MGIRFWTCAVIFSLAAGILSMVLDLSGSGPIILGICLGVGGGIIGTVWEETARDAG